MKKREIEPLEEIMSNPYYQLRDEYNDAEKIKWTMNDNHESEIYSLYEFRQEDNTRVKSTAAFDKQYLEGRYGADPYLSNMLTRRDWA